MPKSDELTPVYIEWYDAAGGDAGVQDGTHAEILAGVRPCLVTTIGWLIGKNETDYLLMQDHCAHPSVAGYRGFYQIPIACVKRVYHLTPKTRKPRPRKKAAPQGEPTTAGVVEDIIPPVIGANPTPNTLYRMSRPSS